MRRIIYLIENTINEKCYVGQTGVHCLARRWKEHVSRSKTNPQYPINFALKKYGKENFKVWCLWEGQEKDVDEAERFYIAQHDSLCPKGYNIESGGNVNKTASDETKRRMNQSSTLRMSEEKAQAILDSKGSITMAMKEFGVSRGCVSMIRNGKRWKHLVKAA